MPSRVFEQRRPEGGERDQHDLHREPMPNSVIAAGTSTGAGSTYRK